MANFAIDISSKFSVLMDSDHSDDEPDVLIQKIAKEKEEEKKRKEKEKLDAIKAKKKQLSQSKKVILKSDSFQKLESAPAQRRGTLNRGTSATNRGRGAATTQTRQANDVSFAVDTPVDRGQFNAAPRGRGGRGAFTSARGGFPRAPRFNDEQSDNSNRQGGRLYERHSGSDKTGVKPIDKRDGSGAHNWGGHEDAIEVGLSIVQDDVNATTAEAPAEAGVQLTEDTAENVAPVDEGDQQMTLKEYFTQLQAQRRDVPIVSKPKRAANEGKNPFENMRVYRKLNAEDYDEESDDEDSDARRSGHHNQQLISFDLRFSRNVADTSAVRGRGGVRGIGPRRGRGAGPRIVQSGMEESAPPKSSPRQLNLDNDDEFPVLG
jgi:plasminogen activator inhibitor 1 RNA-binding protein